MPAQHRPLVIFAAGLFLGGLLGFWFGRLTAPAPSPPNIVVSPPTRPLAVPATPSRAPEPTPSPSLPEAIAPKPVVTVDEPPLPIESPEVPAWQPPPGADLLIQEVGRLPGVVSVVWGEPREVYVVVRSAEIHALSQRVCQILAAAGEEPLTVRFQEMGKEGSDTPVIQACGP